MKKNLRYLAGAAVGAVVALGLSSCVYDPYGSTSVGGSYSSGGGGGYSGGGYGDGYGYGGSSFSTSLFVGTGNSQWGYDPDCYSYYDYQRRCYYDPYLNGYYPLGYRPQVVYGTPHPYGWSRGSSYIRPPGHVSDSRVVNYRDRESGYRNSGYGWAKQVRQSPEREDRRSEQNGYQRKNSLDFDARQRSDSRMDQPEQPMRQKTDARQDFTARPSFQDREQFRQESQPRMQQSSGREQFRQESQPRMQQSSGREQSRYNSPVSSRENAVRQQGERVEKQYSNDRQQAPERVKSNKDRNPKEDDGRIHGYR